MRRRSSLLAVLAAAVLVGGCGGGASRSSPAHAHPQADAAVAAVRTAATRLANSHDQKLQCTQLITPRLATEIYGSVAHCAAIPDTTEDDTRYQVGAVTVSGDGTAEAAIASTAHGQTASGHIKFVQSAGTWRADRYETDFVRATLTLAVTAPATQGAFSQPALRRCMAAKIPSLPDRALRRFLYATLSRDPRARTIGVQFASACPDQLSAYVARQLLTRAVGTHGRSAAQLRCIERKIETSVRLSGLYAQALEKATGPSAAALAGVISGAEQVCRSRS